MRHRSKPPRPEPRHTAEAIAARPPAPSPLRPEHTMPIPALVLPDGQRAPATHAAELPPTRPAEPLPAVRHAAAAFREDLQELQHFRATIRTRGWNGLHMRVPGGRAYEAPDMVIRVSGELTPEQAAEVRERFLAHYRGHGAS